MAMGNCPDSWSFPCSCWSPTDSCSPCWQTCGGHMVERRVSLHILVKKKERETVKSSSWHSLVHLKKGFAVVVHFIYLFLKKLELPPIPRAWPCHTPQRYTALLNELHCKHVNISCDLWDVTHYKAQVVQYWRTRGCSLVRNFNLWLSEMSQAVSVW